MKKTVGVCLVLMVPVIAFMIAYPSVTVRYRLTLYVAVNDQPKTGSGVIEVTYRTNVQILGATATMNREVQGDAVVVELGPKDGLFGLLEGKPEKAGSDAEDIIPVLFNITKGGYGPEIFGRIAAVSGSREVPLELLPLMVRLPNTDDPKSALLFVPPGGMPPNQNVVLKRAVIEIVSSGLWPLSLAGITGTPITRGIEQQLPWLAGLTGYSGGQFNPIWSQPEKNLTASNFTSGIFR